MKDKSLWERIQMILSIISIALTVYGLIRRFMDWSDRFE